MLIGEASQETPEPTPALFNGLISNVARQTLLRGGFASFAPVPTEDVDRFLERFNTYWSRVGDGFTPDPEEVKRQMDAREGLLYNVWTLALRHDVPAEAVPLVAQAPVAATANPLILKSRRLGQPLVIMSEGFLQFILGGVFGVLLWAEGDAKIEQLGKRLLSKAVEAWLTNDPSLGPAGHDVIEATIVDLDITNFALGVADAAFTWAFLHEMGHLFLGHLPTGERVRHMSADGMDTACTTTYKQHDEVAADIFGYERFLGLMPLSPQIRRTLRFGEQIDHAPIVAFELMDVAYRLGGRVHLLESVTHPAPLVRASRLLEAFEGRLSDAGREWYAYWEERFVALRRELQCGPQT